jgi:DNA repair exonuclease SbcCD ATPase subunit
MKLKKITIQGFRSFNVQQTLDFFDNGFHYISGRNLAEPRLGRNGAGKSTIFEALCWVLYGKTSVNIKAGNIKNWKSDTKKCEVELMFEKHDKKYSIYRSYKPNKLSLLADERIQTVTQEEVESLIGLNFQSFLFSVFVSQFSSKFFDLDPAPKLEVFSQTLNLEKWITYSDESQKKRKAKEHVIFSTKTKVEKLQGSLEELQSQDYETKKNEWEERKIIAIAEVERESKEEAIKIETHKKELKAFEKSAKTIKDEVAKIKKEIETITEPLAGLKIKIDKSQTELGAKNANLKNIESQIRKLNKLGAVCSECLQEISEEHIDKEHDKLDSKLKKASDELGSAQIIHGNLVNEQATILSREKLLDDKVFKKEKELAIPETKAISYRALITATKIQMGKTKETIQKMQNGKNPHEESYLKSKERKRILVKEIRQNNKYILDLELKVELYAYWQKAFKQIRLFVINEALGELEIQMNNSLHELGLEGWEIHLAVDRETKSKTISKGFTILVFSPINETLVPFECWSGGEAQRLKMAGTLAMSDFIRSRTGENWNLEAFDEPTAWLGKEGIEDMLEVLDSRSKSHKRPVYIIDHRDFETFGNFDSEIDIVKDNNGSRICLVE